MAQAQYDKFIELRKSGVDAKTARTQAYGETPVAPVAPLNPPTTPPNPAQTPPQTVAGVNGEQFAVAPVNPQTGLSQPAPVAPAPVAPVTPTASITPTPTEAPKDETATIKAQNEAQMALNKQKSQLAIEERQKQEADTKLANTPTDQKSVLNALASGVSVPVQNTQAYRNAQVQYKNYQKFNSMTPSQLVDNMKMGEIDTATSQLLASNPNYIKAKEDFDKFQKNQSINNMIKSVANGATGKTEEVNYTQQASDALAKKLGINETNADAYARIVAKDQEVVQLTQSVSSITKQLNDLNTERNAVYADLKKQYPDMSASAIMTLMSSRTQQSTDQINALNSSLSLVSADLKTALEMAKGEYEATSADIQLQSDIAKEQRTMDNSLALSQMQYDQKIAQQAQAMGTPELAIPSVIDEYAKLGVMAQKSAQQHIADFTEQNQKYGTTLGQYISQMQKDFQEKESYKAKFGETTKPTIQNFGTSDKPDYRQYNQSTGQWDAVSGVGGSSGGGLPTSFTGDTTSYIASKEGFRDKAYQDSGGVWTIGYGTTKINGKPVQPGQTITQEEAQKLLQEDIVRHSNWKNYIDESTLSDSQKTALASFEYNLGPGIWDKGAVNIINMIKSGDLQGAGKEMIKYNTVKGTPVKGLTNRRTEEAGLLMKQGAQGTGTFTATEEAWANNIMNGKAKISDITTKDNVDKGKVLQLMNQKTGGTTGTMQTNIQTGLEVVNSLINHPGFTDVVGLPSIFANPLGYSLPGTSARDFKAELKRMEAIGFLNMIPQMQGMGALSNSEGSRLAAAYSKLSDTGIGETEYKAELTRLKEGMEKALKNMGAVIPEQPKQTTGGGQTVGGELDYSKYE